MTDYKQMTRMLSAELLRKECRLSERQMRLLKLEQIEQGKLKLRQREVELSEPLAKALDSLPCSKRYIFSDYPIENCEQVHHFLVFKR